MKRPVPFGKYHLLDRVNVGGMAEVFQAKALGVEGFERLVAVKRILPSIAADKEFIEMFIDEAKIAVQLNHPNIAQIFELGKVGDSHYIAMEYVQGKDLRAIFDRCRKEGGPMAIAQACFIVMSVCEGLDYAHNKRDPQGAELHLVHRDVSPQNMLVSFDGDVKLIDFGIAKAAGKASKTQAGILKGKFSYMSPEQVRGLNIDRRSDIFSLGIVLYELLTGERLFLGESDFATLEKVRNVEILPPSAYNRDIPDELERIVFRALTKDADDRYSSAAELHDDLQSFLYQIGDRFSRKELAAFMRKVFANEIEDERLRLEQYPQILQVGEDSTSAATIERLDELSLLALEPSEGSVVETMEHEPPTEAQLSSLPGVSSGMSMDPPEHLDDLDRPPPIPLSRNAERHGPPPLRRPPAWNVANVANVDGALAISAQRDALEDDLAMAGPTGGLKIDADEDDETSVFLDDEPAPVSIPPANFASDMMPRREVTGEVRMSRSEPGFNRSRPGLDHPPAPLATNMGTMGNMGTLAQDPPSWRPAKTAVPMGPSGVEDRFDRHQVAQADFDWSRLAVPSASAPVPSDPMAAPRMRTPTPRAPMGGIHHAGGSSRRIRDSIVPPTTTATSAAAPGSRSLVTYFAAVLFVAAICVWSIVWWFRRTGAITVTSFPSDVSVYVNDELVTKETPATFSKAPGNYKVSVKREGYATKEYDIKLEAGDRIPLHVGLVNVVGEVAFVLHSEPPRQKAYLDGHALGGETPFKVRDVLPGTHKLEIRGEGCMAPWQEEFTVEAGKPPVELFAKLKPKGIKLAVESEPVGAKIYLIADGRRSYSGETPRQLALDPDKQYSVVLEQSGYHSRTEPIAFDGRCEIALQVPMERIEEVAAAPKRRPAAPPVEGAAADSEGASQAGEEEAAAADAPADEAPPPKRRAVRAAAPPVEEGEASTDDSGMMAEGESDGEGPAGYLKVNSRPWTRILIDGEDTGLTTPQAKITLSPGTHVITLVNPEFGIHKTKKVVITAKETSSLIQRFEIGEPRAQTQDEY